MIKSYNATEIRQRKKFMERANKEFTADFVNIPSSQWPTHVLFGDNATRHSVMRSKDYLVQVFRGRDGAIRMSVNRTVIGDDGNFKDGMTWDDLQAVKSACGFATFWGVEIYPPAKEVVNVANMRHLFLLPEKPTYAWLKSR